MRTKHCIELTSLIYFGSFISAGQTL